jgi:hypothetical protein
MWTDNFYGLHAFFHKENIIDKDIAIRLLLLKFDGILFMVVNYDGSILKNISLK